MKAKKLIATGLVASMLMLALTGCGAGGNSGESAKDTDKGSVYFLNFKSELSSEWEEVAGTFTKETGIDMKVVTAGSGTYEQTLKSELSKKEMPTLSTPGVENACCEFDVESLRPTYRLRWCVWYSVCSRRLWNYL